jgi:ATP-dependent Clp protease protease subunit
MKATNQYFKVRNAGETAEIYLYDVIGEDFFGGISAKQFADELGKLKNAKVINVRINSPGGDVFAGTTMATLLRSHPAQKHAYVDGLSASIATRIMLACDTVEMAANSMAMIHEPFGGSMGTASDHRKLADLLDTIRVSLAEGYASKTGLPQDQVEQMMADETWFTAQEAVDIGLADSIGSEMAIAACVRSDLFKFKHMPAGLAVREPEPEPVLTFEDAMRQKINSMKTRR